MTPEDLAKSGTEEGAQTALFCWAQQNLERYPDLKWLFHCPNGGLRDKRTAARLKATGVKAGVPDIWLPVRRRFYSAEDECWLGYSGLIIELKVGKGKPSKEQSEWLDYLWAQGYCTRLCYGYEAARDEIIQYLELK